MSSKTTVALAVISCGAVVLLTACAAKTQIGASWKDPEYTRGRIKKVLVIGVAAKEDRREVFENQFMTTFRNAGVEAEASHTLIPNVEKLTKEMVDAAIRGAIPTGYYNSLYGYYGYAYSVVHAPDYTDYKEIYSLETNLYEISSEKLIWTVQSQAVRKVSIYDTIKTFTAKIISRLKADGFI